MAPTMTTTTAMASSPCDDALPDEVLGGDAAYLNSNDDDDDCPGSPDGAGCTPGKWQEPDSNRDVQDNPRLRVVAASVGQQQG